jgi:hypothetical protein
MTPLLHFKSPDGTVSHTLVHKGRNKKAAFAAAFH